MTRLHKAVLGSSCLACAALTTLALLEEGPRGGGLQQTVQDNLVRSGVEHPVTAVLLNFRFYDTWLELAVLWAGILACLALRGNSDLRDALKTYQPSPMLGWLVTFLFPLTVLASGYLLWLGKFSSGGAFQAGVVLGSGLVRLALTGRPNLIFERTRLLKPGLLLGVLGFAFAALTTLLLGRAMGEFEPSWAGKIILAVEFLAAISIGLSLPCLLAGLQRGAPSLKPSAEGRSKAPEGSS